MTIDRSTFAGNTATFAGGAIAVESLNAGSSVTITNDTFTGNTASGASAQGAALYPRRGDRDHHELHHRRKYRRGVRWRRFPSATARQ